MIWFFEREGERLKCEISRDETGSGYRVIVRQPDGTQNVEQLDAATDLIERAVRLLRELRDDGWRVG
jgi:hypothetical protein